MQTMTQCNRKRLYDSRAFARSYHYEGPLGALYSPA